MILPESGLSFYHPILAVLTDTFHCDRDFHAKLFGVGEYFWTKLSSTTGIAASGRRLVPGIDPNFTGAQKNAEADEQKEGDGCQAQSLAIRQGG